LRPLSVFAGPYGMKFAAMRQSSIRPQSIIAICCRAAEWRDASAGPIVDRANTKKESRAKALLECAHKVPVISTIVFIWSGCDFSRRRFSSHRLGPQP
jgi:hypothetical protein